MDKKFILLVCLELHIFEHTRANNLKKTICVAIFLAKYGDNGKNFYGGLIDELR